MTQPEIPPEWPSSLPSSLKDDACRTLRPGGEAPGNVWARRALLFQFRHQLRAAHLRHGGFDLHRDAFLHRDEVHLLAR